MNKIVLSALFACAFSVFANEQVQENQVNAQQEVTVTGEKQKNDASKKDAPTNDHKATDKKCRKTCKQTKIDKQSAKKFTETLNAQITNQEKPQQGVVA